MFSVYRNPDDMSAHIRYFNVVSNYNLQTGFITYVESLNTFIRDMLDSSESTYVIK